MSRRTFVVVGIVECLQPDRGGWELIDSHGADTVVCPFTGWSSTPNVEGLPDLADLPDLVIPDVDSCTGNDTVLYIIYWRNCTVAMLSDVSNNLEILNTPLILVIMLLQVNNIFKKFTSGITDPLTEFQDNLAQNWWPDFPTGVTGHVRALQFK